MPLTRIDSAFLDLDSQGGIDFDVQSGVPTLKVDATNHRVGIGNNSPLYKLDVAGDINISSGSNYLINGSQMSTANIAEDSSYQYFSNTRAISAVQGSALDMGSNNITTTGKVLYSNVYSAEGDLPSASTYHGMFAHVHGTGRGYFAHAGNWVRLLDQTGGDVSGSFDITTTSGARALTINAPTLGPYIAFENGGTPFADIGSEAGLVGSGSNTDMLTLNARGARDLSFRTNSNERLRITSDGKVGIGTDTISDNLEVFAPTNASLQIRGGGTGSDASRTAQLKLLASGSKLYVMEADATDGSFRILDSSTERLRITSAGDLCLGSAVGANNDGSGISIYNSSFPRISFRNSTTGNTLSDGSQLYLVSDDLYITNNENADVIFRTNATPRLNITSAGIVNIGDSSPNATGGGALNVYSDAVAALSQFVHASGNGGLRIGGTGPGSAANLVFSNDYNANSWTDEWTIRMDGSNNSLQFLSGGPSGSEKVRIDSAGDVGIGITDPKQKLHVSRIVLVTGETAQIRLNANDTDQSDNDRTILGQATGSNHFVSTAVDNDTVLRGTSSGNILFGIGTSEKVRITSAGNLDINGTPPWSVTGGNYRNLSISGNDASSSGFLWLGNGAATTNADFDLGRINFMNGGTIVSQIKGTTQTSANDDGRISFFTKESGSNLSEKVTITAKGTTNIGFADTSRNANSLSSLNLDLATWMRIGDGGGSGGTSFSNGIGIKFHDDSVAHYSVGSLSGKFIVSQTNVNGGELFPTSGRADIITILSAGKVGINDSTPAYHLSIQGTGAVRNEITCTDNNGGGAGVYFRTMNGGSMVSNATIRTNNTGNLQFFNGTNSDGERLRITPTGQVNVGNNLGQQSYLFSVCAGGSAGASPVVFENNHSGHYGGLIIKAGVIDRECRLQSAWGSSFMTFYTEGAQLIERFRIKSNGDLKHTGLRAGGGDNKLARFVTPSHNTNEEDVMVYQAENESSFNQLSFGGGTSTYNAVTKMLFFTASAVDTTAGTIRLRIEPQGDVVSDKTLIATDSGTTARNSFYNGNRGVGLFARDAYSSCGEHMEIGTDADKGWSNIYLNRINWNSGNDERMISFSVNNTARGTITATTSGVTYNTGSDIRLKTDIRPISDATSKLMAMNPVTHKWKEHPDSDSVHGFIAQEMQDIAPESVSGKPDGEKMMGMDYGRITPIIVAALQNAIEEINTLKQRISELEN